MKVNIERCGNSQEFCDRCLSRAVRENGERPCFVGQEDDGEKNLTLTIVDDGETRTFKLTPDQQKVIFEASRDLPDYEVPAVEAQE